MSKKPLAKNATPKKSPVTVGKRYAFLPFLCDDTAAQICEANNQFLGEGVGAYKAG